uniref:Structural maintenance of chromosomes protein 6 n=1 Tax=Gouania willdenowi TaxID=441366 RepID=A0A8C5HNP3_GOUWI
KMKNTQKLTHAPPPRQIVHISKSISTIKLKIYSCVADVESDAGIVESISMKNFMCHSHLGPFAFGSNVNFFVGNNGSGKSAVLTALIVALGGNAHATNRGLSLKGFVKEGENSADVSITLRNKGKDAYKPEVYSSAIIIDLRITRDGLRSYKLKSKSGHIISTKKEELISILDNFNIQVNNPVSVLTQEMSKHFLHSKGEGDKYKFFMKATQLDQMREDFIYIKQTKHVTNDKIEQQNEGLKELKRKYLEKEDRYKSLSSLDELRDKLQELQKQMAWALVIEMEKDLEPVREKLQADRQSTVKYDEKVEEWKNKIEESERKYKQIQEKLEAITNQVQDLQPKCAELKAEAQKRNTDLKTVEVRGQCSHRTVYDITLVSQDRANRVNQIQTDLENLRHQISTLGQQIDQYEHAISPFVLYGALRKEQAALQRSIEANKRNLLMVERSRSNRLQRFGEHMPALLNAIEEAHKRGQFKQKPRGPLGYLISLKDTELALAVEVCLKGSLQAFTCDNHDDERLLQSIMAKFCPGGRRPVIITSQFLPQVHDTRRRAVNHPQYPSVLQALEIQDPVVTNCLIDQRGIESILLIKNRTEARRLMQGGNPPRNCTQAFSKEGDQIYNNRNYSAEQARAKYFSGDVEEDIRCVLTNENDREDFQEIVSKISVKRVEHVEARAKMADLKVLYEKAEQEYKQHKERISTIAEEAEAIKVRNTRFFVIPTKFLKKEVFLFNFVFQASSAKASEICAERMDISRTARSLDTEINRLKVKISTQQDQQGDPKEIVRQYHEALENYKNTAQQVKNLKSFINNLDKVMDHRLQVYADLRSFMSARCKYYFDSMLAQRGYSGSMTFDHKKETLSISVQPKKGKKNDSGDMRSLSGGERSFSTVCFVLSLWAITEAPFRCLDEFDVYMDMVNRRISMDMMLRVAASQRFRQFIFLTPQSMSSLPDSKFIQIHQLKDPDRDQSEADGNQ